MRGLVGRWPVDNSLATPPNTLKLTEPGGMPARYSPRNVLGEFEAGRGGARGG